MYCPSCGKSIPDDATFCNECGKPVGPGAVSKLADDFGGTPASVSEFASKKIPAGVCGILLGSLGVHKFVLGLTTPGVIMLLVTILTFGFGSLVMGPIGLIEGILYLTKGDREFYQNYAVDKKGWF